MKTTTMAIMTGTLVDMIMLMGTEAVTTNRQPPSRTWEKRLDTFNM